MVYRRAGSRHFYVAVPTRAGWVKRSTGTKDEQLAKRIKRMLDELRDRREWDMLEAAAAGQLELGALYDAWRMNDLDGLRARLADVDLAGHVTAGAPGSSITCGLRRLIGTSPTCIH